jgi:hypothetical protein
MFTNQRREKHLKRTIAAYILLLGLIGLLVLFLNMYRNIKKPLFISPIGKIDVNITFVEKILKGKSILFSKITLLNDIYLIDLQIGGQVRISQNKDLNQQISSLQRILNQLTIEGKSFKNIDFRFNEPVVSF